MNKDVKHDINHFAGIVAEMHGFKVPHGYDFEASLDPRDVALWNLAKASYNFWSLRFVPAKRSK